MPLTAEERRDFLAEPHVAALSVAAGEGRGPLTVPIWYAPEPGGDLVVITQDISRKARLIRAAGRFTLLVERTEPTVRYVSAEGPVVSVEDATEEEHRAMARRYLPPEGVEAFMEQSAGFPGRGITVRMRPEHWLSSDMGAL